MSKRIVDTASLEALAQKLQEIEQAQDAQFTALAEVIRDEERRLLEKSFQLMFEDSVKRAALILNTRETVRYLVWRWGIILAICTTIGTCLGWLMWR